MRPPRLGSRPPAPPRRGAGRPRRPGRHRRSHVAGRPRRRPPDRVRRPGGPHDDLPHLLDDQADHRGRGAHASGGVPAAPRRPRRRPAARAGRPGGPGLTRGAARRHGAGRPADHGARPADLPVGSGLRLRRVRPATGARGPGRPGPSARPPGAAAAPGARRVDADRRLGAARATSRAPAGSTTPAPTSSGCWSPEPRAGRWARCSPSGSSGRWAWTTPPSSCPRPSATASGRVRRRPRHRRARRLRPARRASGRRPPPSPAAARVWCRRSTTWPPSRGCCSPAASTVGDASCPAPRSRR